VLIRGDARCLPLRDACVDCCVSSPPYFGLRDYGTPGQIGLEPSPEAYVAAVVQVYREVWRVLKPQGTCWVNLGDSYTGAATSGGVHTSRLKEAPESFLARKAVLPMKSGKPKDLLGIPWLVAFALRADGWYLRADIIWHKPNPMPESVTDRPTKAHEYLFLLAKSERYYYDAEAIAEPLNWPDGPYGGRTPAGWRRYSRRRPSERRRVSGLCREGHAEQAQRVDREHHAIPGCSLRHDARTDRAALHPRGLSPGWARVGPLRGQRNRDFCGGTARPARRWG
jgi:DNA methylase